MPTVVLADRVLDTGLAALDTEPTHIELCSAQPTTYTEAVTTFNLGFRSYTAGTIFGAPAAVAGGRKVTAGTVTNGTVTTTGTANWIGITDRTNSRLLAAIPLASATAVAATNVFSFGADITLPSGGTAIFFQELSATNKSAAGALSDGNLTWTKTGNHGNPTNGFAKYGLSPELVYWEYKPVVQGEDFVGVANFINPVDNYMESHQAGCLYDISSGTIKCNGTTLATIFTLIGTDYLGVALNRRLAKFWFTKDGSTWNNDVIGNENPVGNVGGIALTNAVGPGYASRPVWQALYVPAGGTFNFGATAYHWTRPTGYGDWYGLATPDPYDQFGTDLRMWWAADRYQTSLAGVGSSNNDLVDKITQDVGSQALFAPITNKPTFLTAGLNAKRTLSFGIANVSNGLRTPTNGFSFDGGVAATTGTVFGVAQLRSAGTVSNACMLDFGDQPAGSFSYSMAIARNGTANSINLTRNASSSNIAVTPDAPFRFIGVFDGANHILYVNNVAGTTGTSTGAIGPNSTLAIGGENNGEAIQTPWTGEISEMGIIKRSISPTERGILDAWLQRW